MEWARIGMHAEIKCDGSTCGHLERVVIDPRTREVLSLVVMRHDGNLKVIEACHVSEAHHGWLHLDLREDQLAAAPAYLDTNFSLPSADWPAPAGLAHPDILWPSHWAPTLTHDISPGPLNVEHHHVPPEAYDVPAGSRVFCSDRECGTVAELVYDPDSEKARGLVIRRGFLFTRDVEVPLGWIDHVDPQGVHLKMSARQLEEVARYFPDQG